MLKFLIVVCILAVPIVCVDEVEEIYEGNRKKLIVQGPSEETFKLQCKNVSGIDIDVQRNDRLYEEFKECAKSGIDMKTFHSEAKVLGGRINWHGTNADFRSTMEENLPLIETFIQTYCPKFENFYPCDDILLPIYTECLNAKHLQTNTIRMSYWRRGVQFVCAKNAEEAIKFVNGKFLECGFAKLNELEDCLKPVMEVHTLTKEHPFIEPDVLCSTFESFKNCALPIFKQCELSDTPFELLKSLFEEIEKENTCAGIANFTTNPTPF